MRPVLIQPPALEPVPLADAKLYLRLDGPDEDELVAALVTAARLLVEAASGRMLIRQVWRLFLDRAPAPGRLLLPLGPALEIVEIRRIGADAGLTLLDPDDWPLIPGAEPPALMVPPLQLTGTLSLDIAFGFGPAPADVPAPLRQAILRMVARWFEQRGDRIESEPASLPADVMALIQPFRRARL
jgi:uncharacterized phiE125 gp8 family phage protein